MHGWWNPPKEVTDFWATGGYCRFLDYDKFWFVDVLVAYDEFEEDAKKVEKSFEEAVRSYYSMNAL